MLIDPVRYLRLKHLICEVTIKPNASIFYQQCCESLHVPKIRTYRSSPTFAHYELQRNNRLQEFSETTLSAPCDLWRASDLLYVFRPFLLLLRVIPLACS